MNKSSSNSYQKISLLKKEIESLNSDNEFYYISDTESKKINYIDLKNLLENESDLVFSTDYKVISSLTDMETFVENIKTPDKKFFNKILESLENSTISSDQLDSPEFLSLQEKYNKFIKNTRSKDANNNKKNVEEIVEEHNSYKKPQKSASSIASNKKRILNRDIKDMYKSLPENKMLDVTKYPNITVINMIKSSKTRHFSPNLRIVSSDLEKYIEAVKALDGDYDDDIEYVKNLFKNGNKNTISKKEKVIKESPAKNIIVEFSEPDEEESEPSIELPNIPNNKIPLSKNKYVFSLLDNDVEDEE